MIQIEKRRIMLLTDSREAPNRNSSVSNDSESISPPAAIPISDNSIPKNFAALLLLEKRKRRHKSARPVKKQRKYAIMLMRADSAFTPPSAKANIGNKYRNREIQIQALENFLISHSSYLFSSPVVMQSRLLPSRRYRCRRLKPKAKSDITIDGCEGHFLL